MRKFSFFMVTLLATAAVSNLAQGNYSDAAKLLLDKDTQVSSPVDITCLEAKNTIDAIVEALGILRAKNSIDLQSQISKDLLIEVQKKLMMVPDCKPIFSSDFGLGKIPGIETPTGSPAMCSRYSTVACPD